MSEAKIFIPLNSPYAYRRHGGVRRSSQLAELYESGGHFVEPIFSSKANFFCVLANVKDFIFLAYFGLTLGRLGIKCAALIVRDSARAISCIGKIRLTKTRHIAIEVGNNFSLILALYLNRVGFRLTVLPSNVEWLVPGQASYFGRWELGARIEKDLYSRAETIYTISDFDAAILRCVTSATVKTVPYFPARMDLEFCTSVAKRRADRGGDGDYFLIVATVHNAPTQMGVSHFLIHHLDLPRRYEIHVAGFGTEMFAGPFREDKFIKILGSLSDNELEKELIGAKGIVICQSPTTGFLTKIVEQNIMGLPQFVTTNYEAAKGLKDFGVYYVSDITEMNRLLLDKQHLKFKPTTELV